MPNSKAREVLYSLKVTEHFTLGEIIGSRTADRFGINNSLPPYIWHQAQHCAKKMERVRIILNDRPIIVTSWYRCTALNNAVDGKPSSRHLHGRAVDFVCPAYGSVDQVFTALRHSNLVYDKLIDEFGRWVHIQFTMRDACARGQSFRFDPVTHKIIDFAETDFKSLTPVRIPAAHMPEDEEYIPGEDR